MTSSLRILLPSLSGKASLMNLFLQSVRALFLHMAEDGRCLGSTSLPISGSRTGHRLGLVLSL